ncbi:DUF676-domain-containing protein [Abortiporus biennis]|nr:DUF676-domain-containing protein [Abortiporus biennis]
MASNTTDSNNVHLAVLIHGMWGNPTHLTEMNRIVRERQENKTGPGGEKVHTLVAETNKEASTYDGIDWGGERVVDEIMEEIKKLEQDGKKVTRFSVLGYSLGGLIGRYVIGILHQRQFFKDIEPVNFATVATPHIGLILYPTLRSSLFATLGPRLLSRTGEQFYAVDKWSATGRPLLAVMADPERIFHQALAIFPNVTFYANAINDQTVPYLTAAVESEDPFMDYSTNRLRIEFDEEYAPLIKGYEFSDSDDFSPIPQPRMFSKKWFKDVKLPLPPALQFKFPFNVLLVAALPVLFPTVLTLIIIRLSKDSRASKSRLKLLESDESYANRLIHIAGRLEKSIEDAAVDLFDDPGSNQPSTIPEPVLDSTSQETLSSPEASSKKACRITSRGSEKEKKQKNGAQLTEVQLKIIASLNSLPNLKKQLAFIDNVLNSHAVIVARDTKKFEHHTRGYGVLRHLADNFVV